MVRRLYLDNAATSFPKPPEVAEAMARFAAEVGASARGAYAEARQAGGILRTCRQRLNALFNGENPNHFIFTLNCTDGLNMAIRGLLGPGDHAITTAMDHNSVLRPLNALAAEGMVTQTRVAVDPRTCIVDPEEIRQAITARTRLIAVSHGSNVTGSIQPIRAIGKIARERDIVFLVDGAQTAGHLSIDVQADGIDLLALPGHKGLLGPQGTGALYIRPGLEGRLKTSRQGGTGTLSEQDVQPDFMPDKFEPGSHNAIGIAGLSEGVAWILQRTVAALAEHDRRLCKVFMEAADRFEGLRIFGPRAVAERMGVFSVRIGALDPVDLARRLEEEFGILTRAGLHRAPLAHQTLGTTALGGTTRLSFGAYVEAEDVVYAADALNTIAGGTTRRSLHAAGLIRG